MKYPSINYNDNRWPCAKELNLEERKAEISHKHKIIYITVPKVGTSSLRPLLKNVFNLRMDSLINTLPLSSISEEDFKNYFVFTFVRDPVKRMESGIGQIQKLGLQYEAKSILSMISNGCIVDAHLFSHAKMLSIKHPYKEGLLEFDFIGTLENFDEDVKFLFNLLEKSPLERKRIVKENKDPNPNSANILPTEIRRENQGLPHYHSSLDYNDPIIKSQMCQMVQHDNVCFPMVSSSSWLDC